MSDFLDQNFRRNEPEVMAIFGEARLVRQLNGRIELLGGTPTDRDQAREWVAAFLQGTGGMETKRRQRLSSSAGRSGGASLMKTKFEDEQRHFQCAKPERTHQLE